MSDPDPQTNVMTDDTDEPVLSEDEVLGVDVVAEAPPVI